MGPAEGVAAAGHEVSFPAPASFIHWVSVVIKKACAKKLGVDHERLRWLRPCPHPDLCVRDAEKLPDYKPNMGALVFLSFREDQPPWEPGAPRQRRVWFTEAEWAEIEAQRPELPPAWRNGP